MLLSIKPYGAVSPAIPSILFEINCSYSKLASLISNVFVYYFYFWNSYII